MQEIRQTEIDGQRGVFVPIYETADVSGWKRIVQMRDDQILELQNTIRQQGHIIGQFAREGYTCPSGVAPAIKEAEDKIAQEYTASRPSRLEAEVKELRELWGKTEDARASMQGEANTAAHDIEILQKRVAELTFPHKFPPKDGYPPREGSSDKFYIGLPEAVGTLASALAKDSGLYESYKANIAIAFYDEAIKSCPATASSSDSIQIISNKAAERFLDNFIHPLKRTEAAKS